MELWPAVKSRPLTTINEFAGVNRLDPFSISPKEASGMKNLSSDEYPSLSVKPGYSFLGAAIGTRILGLGVWKDIELHAVFNDGTWRKWTGSAWSAALKSGLSTTAEWSFCNFKGNLAGINLIGSNGVDTMQRYDGATVAALTGAPAGGNYIEQYADRLWCAVGNELKASVYRTADDWATVNGDDADSWYTEVETPNGETINGIRAGLKRLVVTKPTSDHELFGYAPSDYDVRLVTSDSGVFNNKCTAVLNGVLYQMDDSGIYQYSGGSTPDNSVLNLSLLAVLFRLHS